MFAITFQDLHSIVKLSLQTDLEAENWSVRTEYLQLGCHNQGQDTPQGSVTAYQMPNCWLHTPNHVWLHKTPTVDQAQGWAYD